MDIRRFFGLSKPQIEDKDESTKGGATEPPSNSTPSPSTQEVDPVAHAVPGALLDPLAPAAASAGSSKRKRTPRSPNQDPDATHTETEAVDVRVAAVAAVARKPSKAKGKKPKRSASASSPRTPVVKLVKDPRLAQLSKVDARMLSKRRLRDPVEDTPYDFELVPKAQGCSLRPWRTTETSTARGVGTGELAPEPLLSVPVPPAGMLAGSVLLRVSDREAWSSKVTELLQLCSEAAWRRFELDFKPPPAPSSSSPLSLSATSLPPPPSPLLTPPDAKPLMLEYIADRLDTDDPIWGYQVRHEATGWLQGFVLVTDFTTWCWYFRFDSRAATTGITADDEEYRVTDTRDRDGVVACLGGGGDADGSTSLAQVLEREPRFGDPEQEGVVFSRIAEVSLLGALGCGAWLLRLTLQELASSGKYRFAILQATDQAIPFYEGMGFVRVGCVARHAKGGEDRAAAEEKSPKGKGGGAGAEPAATSGKKKKKVPGPKSQTPEAKTTTKSPTPTTKAAAAGGGNSGGSILEGVTLLTGTVLEPPKLPDGGVVVTQHPEDGYYWLSLWLVHLCQRFKAIDVEQVFHHPVDLGDRTAQEQYLRLIPQPPVAMDLSTMQRKAVNHRYLDARGLVADLHALVNNALAYNVSSSPIYKLAKKLRLECLQLVRAFLCEVSPVVTAATRAHSSSTTAIAAAAAAATTTAATTTAATPASATTEIELGANSAVTAAAPFLTCRDEAGSGEKEGWERGLEWGRDCWVVQPADWRDSDHKNKRTCALAAIGAGFLPPPQQQPPQAKPPKAVAKSPPQVMPDTAAATGAQPTDGGNSDSLEDGLLVDGEQLGEGAATSAAAAAGNGGAKKRGKGSSGKHKRSRAALSPPNSSTPLGGPSNGFTATSASTLAAADASPSSASSSASSACSWGPECGGNNGGSDDGATCLRGDGVEEAVPSSGGDSGGKAHSVWLASKEGAAFQRRLAAAADRDTPAVLGYVHWTFPDQAVEDQYPSYMMARPLWDLMPPHVQAANQAQDQLLAAAAAAAATCSDNGVANDGGEEGGNGSAESGDGSTTETPSPEVAAGYPRGVTPRGVDSFVAKIGASDGFDYLGTFTTVEDASEAYEVAHKELEAKLKVKLKTAQDTGRVQQCRPVCRPVCGSVDLFGNARRWLVDQPPAVTPQRMAWQTTTTESSASSLCLTAGGGGEYGGVGGVARDGEETGVSADADTAGDVELKGTGNQGAGHTNDSLTTLLSSLSSSSLSPASSLTPSPQPPMLPLASLSSCLSATSPSSSSPTVVGEEGVKEHSETKVLASGGAAAVKGSAKKPRGEQKKKLYNRLVTVADQPTVYPYKYWFVYQYVPDMQWCHLCPVTQDGVFKVGQRKGRPRYKLVPEGRAREIDVPASRCTLVEAKQTVHTTSADEEVFDVLDAP